MAEMRFLQKNGLKLYLNDRKSFFLDKLKFDYTIKANLQ